MMLHDNDMADTPSSEMADARKQSHLLRNMTIVVFLLLVAAATLRVVFTDADGPVQARPPAPTGVR
jgi:hypothetical protein